MVAKSLVNRESRSRELQTDRESNRWWIPEPKEKLTLREAIKASFHDEAVNSNFAHSLRSGVGDGDWSPVLSPLPLGVDRHRRKKSVAKYRAHGRTVESSSPEIQMEMGPVVQPPSPIVFIIINRCSPASWKRPAAYQASQRRCRIAMSRSSNAQPNICQRQLMTSTSIQYRC